ncbi:MAG: putative Ig domain-containing protein, partial [Betaproteobacteria bacterium]|nr:putative Ig domain-containing protein [Betaproteobacteria bacterium]
YIATGTCTVRATKAQDTQYNSAIDDVSITVNQGTQTITFDPLTPKLTGDPPFTVSATGGASGNPVTFSATGVCSSSGTNGSAITLTGAAGTCTVTASQAGNANYAAASSVMRSFAVVAPGEVFPPDCQAPTGWTLDPAYPTVPPWIVATDSASPGTCSFKSGALDPSASAVFSLYSFTGDFQTGNISFNLRVSSFAGTACFFFAIDQGYQTLPGANCTFPGAPSGLSGSLPFQTLSFPITAGNHKIWLLYYRSNTLINGSDAAWIDQLSMPLLTSITSGLTASGQALSAFSYQVTATNFPQTYAATGLPPGLSINASTGLISGTPSTAGTYPVMVTVSNPGGAAPSATDTKTVTITINQIPQVISFPQINNKLTTTPLFGPTVSGNASSGVPVVITSSTPSVCIAGGVNGTTLQIMGIAGTCSLTANQAGNTNYSAAMPVSQSFQVSTAASEIFPAGCSSLPAGWTNTAGPGWVVSAGESSTTGACSLKSGAMADTGVPLQADVQVTATVATGQISFKYRVSSESSWDCFQFFIDGVAQNVGGLCSSVGLTGSSGEIGWTTVSFPVTAGTRTFRWRYDKDDSCCRGGSDAVWIDDVVFPDNILTVSRTGSGTGTVFSDPSGIACGSTCSASMSGTVSLTAFANSGSYLSSWSGGGCSGNGTCLVNLTADTTVTANFAVITNPSAPQMPAATPGSGAGGSGQATVSFVAPSFNGGAPITLYTASCAASGQTTRTASAASSPILVTGMTNGVTYACTVTATNSSGFVSAASTSAFVVPRTVPDAPTGVSAAPIDFGAVVSFTPPGNNGGSAVTSFNVRCTNVMYGWSLTVSGMASPITVSGLDNGELFECFVVALNAAGASANSALVNVTPRTVPGTPTSATATPRDGRAIFDFTAPASDGGSPITSYTVSCNGGARTATGPAAPLTVTGLSNGVINGCLVSATNAAGNSATPASINVTPGVQTGSTYWTQTCTACHAMTPTLPQLNAAGTTGAVLTYAIANQPLMTMNTNVITLTPAERAAIAVYLATVRPAAAVTTAFNTPIVVDLSAQIALGTISFESMEAVGVPVNGTLSMISGTSVTFTPAAGFVGMTTFQVRGARAMPSELQGDPITVTVTVNPPPAPVITSMLTATGTNGVMFSYQIVATNSPTSYSAFGLPLGLAVNPMTGLISGTPLVGGSFLIDMRATNAGGNGDAVLMLTLNPAAQTITFGAQSPASRGYAPSGNFMVNPLATASSALPVTYSSTT